MSLLANFTETAIPPTKKNIYEQYFTPEERRLLAEIPENDLTDEIKILRVMLARSFAQVPAGPYDKKHPPLPLELMADFTNTFSRVSIIIGRLIALQYSLHNSHNAMAVIIWQALIERDPTKDRE
jgi:hypothetical protein